MEKKFFGSHLVSFKNNKNGQDKKCDLHTYDSRANPGESFWRLIQLHPHWLYFAYGTSILKIAKDRIGFSNEFHKLKFRKFSKFSEKLEKIKKSKKGFISRDKFKNNVPRRKIVLWIRNYTKLERIIKFQYSWCLGTKCVKWWSWGENYFKIKKCCNEGISEQVKMTFHHRGKVQFSEISSCKNFRNWNILLFY